jgi:phosphoribosylformimino-5-aminoimidazole carboxamide ribotide isomerase
MEIIPVIDIMDGLAVHARHGRREQYRPLQSPLCRSADPRAVMEGLLGLHPFKTVYIADLDALMGKGRQPAVLTRLRKTFPDITFWIDRGLPDHGPWDFFSAEANAVTVVGSESLSEERLPLLADIAAPFILSLDFRENGLMGPEPLLDHPELWPERVILMSLSHVGGAGGPDFARAERFRQRYSRHRFVAAGGVRGEKDLERLEAAGLSAVLIASALHSGAVDSRMLRQFS